MIPFFGTIVNFVLVLVAGVLGTLIKKGIPERISSAIVSAMSVVVLYIGISGALESAPAVGEGAFLSAELQKILIMILSLAIGTVIGELIDIDGALNKLGAFVEKKLGALTLFRKLGATEDGQIAKGLVRCSLLFCVGAMAVNGAIQDAARNPDILLAKTVIDTIVCFTMATTMGIGCALSAFVVLIYQGGITLLALWFVNLISATTLAYMSMTGSLVIVFIGLNTMGVTKVRTANMVPAIFIPMLLAPLFSWIF